jgi:nitrate reductase NapE component
MNNSRERSRGEIIMFAVAAFGVWLSIWAVILVSAWLEAISFILVLACLVGFALRDSD